MTFSPVPTTDDSPICNENIVLRATSTATATVTFGDNRDWRDELREYRRERDIRALMMNRHGVCG